MATGDKEVLQIEFAVYKPFRPRLRLTLHNQTTGESHPLMGPGEWGEVAVVLGSLLGLYAVIALLIFLFA